MVDCTDFRRGKACFEDRLLERKQVCKLDFDSNINRKRRVLYQSELKTLVNRLLAFGGELQEQKWTNQLDDQTVILTLQFELGK